MKKRRSLVKLLRLFVPITKIILILDKPLVSRILNGLNSTISYLVGRFINYQLDFKEYRAKVSTRETFEKQLSTFKCNERSFVFSSVAEFLLDYMTEKDFPDLASFQDCEREIVDKWDDTEGA